MAQERSDIPTSEYYKIAIGQGMYTSELPSNIPDGYSAICYNLVATGDSLENRIGIRRSSVNFQVREIGPGPTSNSDRCYHLEQIDPWSGDSAKPALMWASWGGSVPSGSLSPSLNLIRAEGTHDANDGYMQVTMPSMVSGICQYLGTIYFLLDGAGVQKVTSINWATDTLIYSAVPSGTITGLNGLFTFKDRLWAWKNSNLYYTDIPTVGGLPETWAAATKFVPVVGPKGAGRIKKVIPLGNRLAIFTTNGLFTLLVEGEPASWIFRVLDSKSISTTAYCAFESKGVIYYINTEGAWATNTLRVQKLSPVIEDQFFQAKGSRAHMICPYEDGMVISIAKTVTPPGFVHFDKDNCRIFYSKLDPIAWTEWNFDTYESTTAFRLACMISMSDKIPTYLNPEPTVYSLAYVGNSTEAAPVYSILQLLIMDGGEDQFINSSNNLVTLPISMFLKTKHFDGGNPYNFKQSQKGMIEIFTSDAEHKINTSWDIDATTSVATEVDARYTEDFTVGIGSNLIQLKALFPYRRATFNFRANLQTNESQVKIKDIALEQQASRNVHELVN